MASARGGRWPPADVGRAGGAMARHAGRRAGAGRQAGRQASLACVRCSPSRAPHGLAALGLAAALWRGAPERVRLLLLPHASWHARRGDGGGGGGGGGGSRELILLLLLLTLSLPRSLLRAPGGSSGSSTRRKRLGGRQEASTTTQSSKRAFKRAAFGGCFRVSAATGACNSPHSWSGPHSTQSSFCPPFAAALRDGTMKAQI